MVRPDFIATIFTKQNACGRLEPKAKNFGLIYLQMHNDLIVALVNRLTHKLNIYMHFTLHVFSIKVCGAK